MKMLLLRTSVLFFIIAAFNVFAPAAENAREELKIEGVSSSAKYIPVPTNVDAAVEVSLANAYMNRGLLSDNNPVVQPQF
jgi:hypothetical protein